MSHVATVKLEVRNLAALRAVAESLGLEFREGQRTWRWYGTWVRDYHGTDAAYLNGIDPATYGRCDHALAVKGDPAAYEVGVVRQPNGSYRLVWDFFAGGRGLLERIGQNGRKLVQGYAAEVARRAMLPQGYTVKGTTTRADGTVELQFVKL